MNSSEKQALVSAWMINQDAQEGSAERTESGWSEARVMDMWMEEPDECWEFILSVLKHDISETVQENLAAGAMEGVLSYYGETLIDRVEQEAHHNAKLRSLLGGVWQNRMSEAVWSRIEAIADRSGWD